MTGRLGRRALVSSIGALAGTAALSGCVSRAETPQPPPPSEVASPVGDTSIADRAQEVRSFHGPRQGGVDDIPQPFLTLVALDLAPDADRDTLQRLMAIWTDDISRLMDGRGTLTDQEPELAARPASLTVTVGWGRDAFDAGRITPPPWLAPLPAFAIDQLQDRWNDGDLVLQVCADSPVTVAHAVRRLVTGAAPMAVQRWVQRGFREPLLDAGAERIRNLLGQIDGTVNPTSDDPHDAPLIWDDGSTWLEHSTGLVVRRIAMDLDRWDRADRRSREHIMGRRLADGAPLTGGTELSPPDLEALAEDIAAKLNGMADKFDGVLEAVKGFTGDKDNQGFMANASEAAKSVRQLADTLNKTTPATIQEYKGLAVDARRMVAEIERVVRNLERNPSQFLFGGGASSAGGVPEYNPR